MTEANLVDLQGRAILPYLDNLARLRIEVFREFPYLYDGNLAYERDYLATYASSPDSFFVLALNGDQVVGMASGVPLRDEDEAFRRPFLDAGHDIDRIFYFGESVLRKTWRGKGLGHRFFDAREACADRLGLPVTCFCAVQRPNDHPRRPDHYRPLDGFWQGRGYQRRETLRTRFQWQDLDETTPSEKPMVFWTRGPL